MHMKCLPFKSSVQIVIHAQLKPQFPYWKLHFLVLFGQQDSLQDRLQSATGHLAMNIAGEICFGMHI